MPSISGVMDSDDKQLVGSLSIDNHELQVTGLDPGNSPEYLKNYNVLLNKPSINGVTLQGDTDSDEFGILRPLTDAEIDQIMVVPEEV